MLNPLKTNIAARTRLAMAAVLSVLSAALLLAACSTEPLAASDDAASADAGAGAADSHVATDGAVGDTAGADSGGAPTTPAARNFAAVDLFVGTGGDGFGVGSALPGAAAPLSLVKLSPDTATASGAMPAYSHCGGYAYNDTTIHAFSHTHMHGIGVPAYGNVAFMPVIGWKKARMSRDGRRTAFSHSNEHAEPGYYRVALDAGPVSKAKGAGDGVQVELTAGAHVGYHRWRWPASVGADGAVLVLDMGEANAQGEVLSGEVEVIPGERRVRGYTEADGQHGGVVKVYFDARFSHPFRLAGGWVDGVERASKKAGDPGQKFKLSGKKVGAWLAFELGAAGGGRQDSAVRAAVGISYVDPAGAKRNREEEVAALSPSAESDDVAPFDDARAAVRDAWLKLLGQIEVEGGTESQRRIFFSALYHVYQHPTQFSDRDGRYLGFDGKIHTDKRPFYSDFSLWDTYRTLHPLLILLQPKLSGDLAQSLVTMAEQWGGVPRWPLASEDAGSMIGTSADIVLAGSYLKGAQNFDVNAAWPYLWAHANGPVKQAGRGNIDEYIKRGYIPEDVGSSSVSRTQEYAWDDFALANLATALGKKDKAAILRKRSRNFAGLWHAGTRFFRGRNKDGSWLKDFNPIAWQSEYVEGNAWQHLWLTPYVDFLASLMGGDAGVVERLDTFFAKSKAHWDTNETGRWTPLPYYWHGNEPDIHAAWLYIDAGAAAKAQRWVRWVMEEHYGLGAKGLAGNDDAGTLSAWYVFAALGFYPIAGSDQYWLGAPAFSKATIHLPSGDLVVQTSGVAGSPFVETMKVGGKGWSQGRISHKALVQAGAVDVALAATETTWPAAE